MQIALRAHLPICEGKGSDRCSSNSTKYETCNTAACFHPVVVSRFLPRMMNGLKEPPSFIWSTKKNTYTFVYTYTNVHTSSKLYKCISNSICFFVSFRWTVFEVHNKRQTKRHMHFKCIDARFWVLLMVYKTRAEICIMSASTVAARCYCERELFFLPIHYIYICGYAQSVGTSDR